MADRVGGIGWLQRLWRRADETAAAAPGTPALMPVETAVAALEVQLCGGVAHGAGVPASAAAAQRLELPGPPVLNAFGRPVVEEFAASARDRIAVATGMALAGLRSTAFLVADELVSAGEALHGCSERLAPLVLHASGATAGHAGCLAAAESGCFQVIASSGQEALDWTLVARWVSERALVPGLVVTDAAAVESLQLPDAETIVRYLGRPDEPIPAPTEAQRILFGVERARLLPWFDPDRPVATGGIRGGAEADRARAGARHYFWEPVAELLNRGMAELTELTRRPLAQVQPHRLDDAELVLVVRGTGVQVARAVADHLRETRRWKVGVLGVPWLRPFPAVEVARALAGRRAVAVVEALGAPPPGGAAFFREVAEAAAVREGWISAIAGPEPAALASLCELLRRPDRPAHVDLERRAAPPASGFPRRDALLQAVANIDPSLRESVLPEAEPPGADPREGRSAGLVGRESELPPDALAALAEAVGAACGSFVRGTEARPEPGVWEARVRAAEGDFPDPGPINWATRSRRSLARAPCCWRRRPPRSGSGPGYRRPGAARCASGSCVSSPHPPRSKPGSRRWGRACATAKRPPARPDSCARFAGAISRRPRPRTAICPGWYAASRGCGRPTTAFPASGARSCSRGRGASTTVCRIP